MSNTTPGLSQPSENSSNVTIEEINQEKVMTLIPVIVLFAILMVIGIVGNCLVVYIFGFRLKSGTQNILIVSLALFDVLTSTLSMPHEITVSMFMVTYPSAISCKIFRFINTFCSAGSMFTLLVIAVDRYRKICLPLKPQMYNHHVKISMIPILILAVLFGLPAFAVHGQRTIDTDIPGLYGMDCSTPDEIGKTVIPLIYNLVMFLVFFTITIALAVLYTFILRETNRHTRNRMLRAQYILPAASNSSSDRAPAPTNVSSSDTGFGSGKVSMLDVTQESDVTCYTVNPPTLVSVQNVEHVTDKTPHSENEEVNTEKSTLTTPSQSLHSSMDNLKPAGLIPAVKIMAQKIQKSDMSKTSKSKNVSSSAKPEKKRLKNKTTIIAFVVTLVFILSFLPHFIVQVTKFSKLIVDYRLHGAELIVYNLCLRSYFINSVSNPFIYGALNTKFSSEVRRLLRRMTCRS